MKLCYQAKDGSGLARAGELEADSLAEARLQLRNLGLFPLSLRPAGGALPAAASLLSGRPSFGRVKPSQLVTMVSQLTIMCQSGVSLAEALGNLAENAPPGGFKNVLSRLHQDVLGGCSFSTALRKHPRVFRESFVAGIAAGEKSGELVRVLERLASLIRNERRLMSSIWSMLTYPLLLMGVMGVVLLGLVFFVLPQFEQVFAGFGQPVPPLTQILLSLGTFARQHLVFLVVASIVVLIGGIYATQLPVFHRLWDRFVMHAYVVRDASRTLATGRSFHLLGAMLQSGVPLLECIQLSRAAARNSLFKDLFADMEQELLRGQGISNSLAAASFLPAGAAQMVSTAERSGRLGQVMQTIGEYYEEEGETCLRNVVKILEPVLIILMGVVVATVVMSIMLPLFDASTMVK